MKSNQLIFKEEFESVDVECFHKKLISIFVAAGIPRKYIDINTSLYGNFHYENKVHYENKDSYDDILETLPF